MEGPVLKEEGISVLDTGRKRVYEHSHLKVKRRDGDDYVREAVIFFEGGL